MQELFDVKTIVLNLRKSDKEGVIGEMIDLLAADGVVKDKKTFKKAVFDRESLSTTGFGGGIAIPHAKSKAVLKPRVAFARSEKGIDYDSEDGGKAHLFFMVAAGETDYDLHIRVIAAVSRKLADSAFREAIMASQSKEEILSLLKEIR